MRILTVFASRHGSTREIAEAIAAELRSAGHEVTLQEAGAVGSVVGYDAAIIGSAVYVGKWLSEATKMVEKVKDQLKNMPVWLFSSGPLGAEEPHPPGDPEGLPELASELNAREHRVFVGRLDKSDLGLGERLVVRAVKAPEGDFRDWEAIRSWARAIAQTLQG